MNSTKKTRSRPLSERFWEKVDKSAGEDACWIWTGSKIRGYGSIYANGRNRKATQISWEFYHGEPFPTGMSACHACDNPSCVNPKHIWAGTQKDNALDCVAKGRSRSNLTPSDIFDITKLLASGDMSNKQIAEKYGCDPATVSLIRQGKAFDPIVNSIDEDTKKKLSDKNFSAKKLTIEEAKEIKRLHHKMKQTDIAEMFGVNRSTVQRIHRGTLWAEFCGDIQPDSVEALRKENAELRRKLEQALSIPTDSTQILDEVRRAERERCAKVCENKWNVYGDDCATAIRAME